METSGMSAPAMILAATCGLALCGCFVVIDEGPGRSCDQTHGCERGRLCVDQRCVDPGSVVDGGPAVDVVGWTASPDTQTSAARTQGGSLGSWALTLTSGAGSTNFGINDSPSWVAATPGPGVRYCFEAQLRSTSLTKQSFLYLREYSPSAQNLAELRAYLSLTPEWQRVAVELSTSGAAGSSLNLQILVRSEAAGESFEVDDISIRATPP
jgi:hypothetical protein